MPGLVYSTDGHQVFVDLYLSSVADVTVGGAKVHIAQTTDYPWDGKVTFEITADRAVQFPLKLRVPGWMGGSVFGTDLYRFASPSTDVAGVAVDDRVSSTREPGWFSGPDVTIAPAAAAKHTPVRVSVSLPMPVRRIIANPAVKDDAGRAAIQRGPVVYALEGVDNDGHVLLRHERADPMRSVHATCARADLLGGVMVLTATLRPSGATPARTITAISYFRLGQPRAGRDGRMGSNSSPGREARTGPRPLRVVTAGMSAPGSAPMPPSPGAPRDAIGLKLIVAYKFIKASAEGLFGGALLLFGTSHVTEGLRLGALRLQRHATAAWSLALSERLLQAATARTVLVVALAAVFDGVLSGLEGWALQRRYRWSSWLVVGTTVSLLPFELVELARRLSAGRVALLIVNTLIVVYLVRLRRRQPDA